MAVEKGEGVTVVAATGARTQRVLRMCHHHSNIAHIVLTAVVRVVGVVGVVMVIAVVVTASCRH